MSLAGEHRGTALPHCHAQAAAWPDEPEGANLMQLKRLHYFKKKGQNKKRYICLRVEADRCNDGAEEGLRLRVAACLQQGPPVL